MLNALFTSSYPGIALIIASAIGFVLIPGISAHGKYGTWTPLWIRAGVFLVLLVLSFVVVLTLVTCT
jgi:hypothetical protein